MEVATGALGSLLPKLGQLLQEEYNLQKGVKKEIEFLSRELESMRAALCSVGEVPREELKEQVRIWARDVRELSYDMEDIVDAFLVRVQGPEHLSKRGAKRFISKMMDALTKATTRHEIGQEIKEIKERVKEVAKRRDRYRVDDITPSKTLVDPRITALYTKATDLVGIDMAREELITRLAKGDDMSSMQKQRIVSIVGFGGLGKTTLAKAVYDELKGQFDCTAFVSVSRNPFTKKVLKDMLYELDKVNYGNIHSTMLEEMHLINLVWEFLQDKRYLIVIDDIWDAKPWDIIKCVLGENNMSSRIITTTRTIGLAEQLGDCYKLKPLTHESSKTLFYKRIFGSIDKCPEQYSTVSEKNLNKCGGVPLAIITTSSLLANKLGDIEVWYHWCESIGSGLGSNHDVDNMRKILSFSYYDLPSHLKTCLLYLSTFPEDYKILRDRLVWRWIAEGFVQHGEGSQSLYDIGLGYFNELINRSLIQPGKHIDEDVMSVMSCRVHDMVLDFICSLSREEGFVTTVLGDFRQSTSSMRYKVRRLSIHSTACPTMNTSKLRALTIFNNPAIIKSMPSLLSYLLRVLDLEGCNLEAHPGLEFLGNLVHLRFLTLLNSRYAGEVPEEIGKLRFLQLLDLAGTDIKKLPSSIVGLRQLMCLGLGESVRLPSMFRNLTSLEALVTSNVDSAYIAEELGHLTQLRKLFVRLKEDKEGRWDESMCNALVGSLGKLQKIQTLVVRSVGVTADLGGSVESLGSLRRLTIDNISLIPTWINPTSLIALSYLQIKVAQVRREDVQVLGLLPALRVLKVYATTGIRVGEKFMVRADASQCLISCIFLGFSMVPSMLPPGAMPKLEHYHFSILVEDSCDGESIVDHMDLGHLPSLQTVWVELSGNEEVTLEVEKEVIVKLDHETDVHPNHPRFYWRKGSAQRFRRTGSSACTYEGSW